MCRLHLAHIDHLDEMIARLDRQTEAVIHERSEGIWLQLP
jgi:hypothetical protein